MKLVLLRSGAGHSITWLGDSADQLQRWLRRRYSENQKTFRCEQAIAQVVEIRKRGRKELNAYLQKRFTDITPNEDVRWLSTRPWRAIFTTNYDNGIERAYELNPQTIQIPVIATVTADVGTINPMIEVPIYHLHGALFGIHEPHVS